MNTLPSPLIGIILTNSIDPIKTARRLSQTCSSLRDKVHSFAVLYTLAIILEDSLDDVAAKLNTIRCRQLLWKSIQQNGDLESYQIFRDIHNIGMNVLQEAKNAGFHLIAQADFKPDPRMNQSFQGFRLNNHSYIETPFGEIPFLAMYNNQLQKRGLIALIKSLNGTFDYMIEGPPDIIYRDEIIEIDVPLGSVFDGEIIEKKVSREGLKTKIGSQSLFSHHFYELHAYYKISEVNGRAIPEFKEREEARKPALILRILEMLEYNFQGIDPITKKISI